MTSDDLGGHFWPHPVPHFEGCPTTFILWIFLIGGLVWPEMAFWPLFWPFLTFKVDLLKLNIAYNNRRVKRDLHAKFEVIWWNGVDFYKEHTYRHTHTLTLNFIYIDNKYNKLVLLQQMVFFANCKLFMIDYKYYYIKFAKTLSLVRFCDHDCKIIYTVEFLIT